MRKLNIEDIFRKLQKEPTPQTEIVGGGSERKYFEPHGRDPNQLKKYREIYQKGGPIAEAIDSYAFFTLTNGYRLEGENEAAKNKVQEWMDSPQVEFESIVWQGIIDALLFGTAYQEIIPTVSGGVYTIIPRDSTSFKTHYDRFGQVIGYVQILNMVEKPIDRDRMLTLTLFQTGGEIYGESLIKRAYDDIMRDVKIADGITNAAVRHGFPKLQVKVGQPGEHIPRSKKDEIRKDLEDLTSKNDFVTDRDVDMINFDVGSLQSLDVISTVSMQRLALALGVPRELYALTEGGLGSGGPSVRLQLWYDKIGTIQKKVARTYNQVIDRISGAPGEVWIEFNDVSPEDEDKVASFLQKVASIYPLDPFQIMSKKEIRQRLNLPEEIEETPSMIVET